jgi:starch-binding outer membrane protein, SusD/RagB family
MKAKIRYIVSIVILSMGCADLDVPVYDQRTDFWKTSAEVEAGIASAYVGLRYYAPGWFGEGSYNIYILNEATTDELIVPNRTRNWNDNFLWEPLWKHTWHPTNSAVKSGWSYLYSQIANINSILQNLDGVDASLADIPVLKAEMKTLRAFYYYLALDLFGNIPLYTTYDPSADLSTVPRKDVFDFVEQELLDNLEFLSSDVTTLYYGRATRWFALTVLAKLYLNAEVYTGIQRWQDCREVCELILSSSPYHLEEDFFSNFAIENEASNENIFSIPFSREQGVNLFMIQRLTLHYNSGETFGLESGGANGFCSTAEFVNLFDDQDLRKKMFLIGQQYRNSTQYEEQVPDPENMQTDNDGHPLAFDPVITTFLIQDPKVETSGARCAKWEFNKVGNEMSNDFAVFRLPDVILMKAEAELRLGLTPEALVTINQKSNGVSIRSRAGLPDFTLSEMTLEGILKERACELAWEGHRRNDLIRFGHFTDARIPEKEVSDNFRTLFPVPKSELDQNIQLTQNPGY